MSHALRLQAAIAISLGLFCPCSHAETANPVVAEISRLEQDYSQSFVTGDTKVAQRLVADDFVGLEPDGNTSDRAAILADVKSTPRPASLRIPALAVRIQGDTAIALGTEEDTYASTKTVTRRRWLDTWKKTPGGWRLISSAEILLKP